MSDGREHIKRSSCETHPVLLNPTLNLRRISLPVIITSGRDPRLPESQSNCAFVLYLYRAATAENESDHYHRCRQRQRKRRRRSRAPENAENRRRNMEQPLQDVSYLAIWGGFKGHCDHNDMPIPAFSRRENICVSPSLFPPNTELDVTTRSNNFKEE